MSPVLLEVGYYAQKEIKVKRTQIANQNVPWQLDLWITLLTTAMWKETQQTEGLQN